MDITQFLIMLGIIAFGVWLISYLTERGMKQREKEQQSFNKQTDRHIFNTPPRKEKD